MSRSMSGSRSSVRRLHRAARWLCITALASCGDNLALPEELTPCPFGFEPSGDACVDVDECATAATTCDARAVCTNRAGGFTCACPPGWSGDGTTCRPALCEYDYLQGHGDMYTTWTAERGLAMALRSELEPGKGELAYDPFEVCIHVPRSTYDEIVGFGGRPAGPGWDPVGVAEGQPFWYLPELPIEGTPWFGIASDVSPAGGVPVGVFGESLTLTIRVTPPADAAFSAWGSVDDPEAPPFVFSTTAGLDTSELFTSSHRHLSWAFTRPGEYLVEASIAGELADSGERRASAPVTYRFIVH